MSKARKRKINYLGRYLRLELHPFDITWSYAFDYEIFIELCLVVILSVKEEKLTGEN